MIDEETREWRHTRFVQAIEKFGGTVALGKALGYPNGETMSHYFSGRRKVSERIIASIELLPDMKGWFWRAPEVDSATMEIYGYLAWQKRFIERLPAKQQRTAKLALKYFVDQPAELSAVADSLAKLMPPKGD